MVIVFDRDLELELLSLVRSQCKWKSESNPKAIIKEYDYLAYIKLQGSLF